MSNTRDRFRSLYFDAYQDWAVSLSSEKDDPEALHRMMHGAVGLAGEAGEALEIVKKIKYGKKPLNDESREHFKKELGDALWYIAEAAKGAGLLLSEVVEANIKKLETRYPNGFETARMTENQD